MLRKYYGCFDAHLRPNSHKLGDSIGYPQVCLSNEEKVICLSQLVHSYQSYPLHLLQLS